MQTPEFAQTNGGTVPAVPTVPVPGSGGTPMAPDNWKTNAGPQGLMKEPPLVAANRNGPTPFVTQGQSQVSVASCGTCTDRNLTIFLSDSSQGAVMMVYGLDNTTSNTDKLFNLVCLYGNVARVSSVLLRSNTSTS